MREPRKRWDSCSSPLRVTAKQLLSFLAITSPLACSAAASNPQPQIPLLPHLPVATPPRQQQTFYLRHILHHGTHKYPGLLRKLDVPSSSQVYLADTAVGDSGLTITSDALNIQRMIDRSPSHMFSLMDYGRRRGAPVDLPASAWTVDQISAPDVTDKATVLSLAHMCADAYVQDPADSKWEDVGPGFNYTADFGWEADGLRGHIFTDIGNRTIVIGLKGTSQAVFDGAETTTNDKVNDNLFFGCCCGQGGSWLWRHSCECMSSTYTCNSTCLTQNLWAEDKYYNAARMLYGNVTALFPNANVWLTGHSLGGAVSGFLGMTYGLPAVTFESPGDAMAASRLGLPTPPAYDVGSNSLPSSRGIFHFGHTGDPIFTGTCFTCTLSGYSMESVCHAGLECRYDTVNDLGYHNWIGNHRIVHVITDVLEVYDEPAECKPVVGCVDCFNWKFFHSNGSEKTTTSFVPSTSSVPSYTQTRSYMCETPGWFGCLDTTTVPPKTTTTSTSTCENPGWFICYDPTSSTTTMTTTFTVPRTTCETPGWFWCRDEPTSTTFLTMTTTSTSMCETPGWFGCYDPTSSTMTTTATFTVPRTTCETPGWFWCRDEPTTTTILTRTATATSICETPGLWGCWDATSDTTTKTTTYTVPRTTCETPGWFWGCYDEPTTTTILTATATFTSICETPGWFWCRDATVNQIQTVEPPKATARVASPASRMSSTPAQATSRPLTAMPS